MLWLKLIHISSKRAPKIIFINPYGVKARIFEENLINVMTADALFPWVARASTAMALNMKENDSLFSVIKGGCWETTENANMFLCLPKYFST